MRQPRINLWRLTKRFLFVLVLPSAFALFLDNVLGVWPFITIIAVIVVFPIAAFVISRSALNEFNRVLQIAEEEVEAKRNEAMADA